MQTVKQNVVQSNQGVKNVGLELDGGKEVNSIAFVSQTDFGHVDINIHTQYNLENYPISFIRTEYVQ